ncbi:MAG: hypothetical protein GMKNLPBB_00901 [Myxococcota bacterium]|nr:hypothetical protein [Myxococcota bacterium]
MRRKWVFRGILIAFGVLSPLGVAEFVARKTSPVDKYLFEYRNELGETRRFYPDGYLLYSFAPNVKHPLSPGVELKVTNSLGFRDREYAKEKPRNTWRIVLLGDSVAAESLTMPVEKTFENVLEDRLNSGLCDKHIEIINLAVSGYDTELEVRMFETWGLALQPDAVWVAFYLNDIHHPPPRIVVRDNSIATVLDVWGDDQKGAEGFVRETNPLFTTLFFHSSLFRYFYVSNVIRNASVVNDDRLIEMQERAYKALGRLTARARERKMDVVVVMHSELRHSRELEPNLLKHVIAPMHAWSSTLGFPIVDFTGALDSMDLEKLRMDPKDYAHMNETGHRVIADLYYDRLRGGGFLPPGCH